MVECLDGDHDNIVVLYVRVIKYCRRRRTLNLPKRFDRNEKRIVKKKIYRVASQKTTEMTDRNILNRHYIQ